MKRVKTRRRDNGKAAVEAVLNGLRKNLPAVKADNAEMRRDRTGAKVDTGR